MSLKRNIVLSESPKTEMVQSLEAISQDGNVTF